MQRAKGGIKFTCYNKHRETTMIEAKFRVISGSGCIWPGRSWVNSKYIIKMFLVYIRNIIYNSELILRNIQE